ncbi:MAG TPA: PrsW family glutamic-type intramembrane protease [Acidimicrobiia bacterium]|nr:PrsW family glutamic-type intramembrane protease [Acidimicrobiia bacterium]
MDDLADEPALQWRPDLPAGPQTVWERRNATSHGRRWTAVLAVAVASGPFAIAAAMVENSFSGAALVLLLVAVGPLIEEMVKGAGALFLAEQRPWLVPAAWTLPVLTCLSGLVFASIENWWYLAVLIDDPSRQIIQWRWIFGPLVHGVGSLIVGFGAARLWRQAMTTGRRAAFDVAQPYIVTAAVFHGLYNGLALLLTLAGVFPDAP